MSACQIRRDDGICGARTDGFMCIGCGTELRRTVEELPGLMHDLSVLATGQARVYRRNGKPVPAEDLVAWDAERTALPARLRAPVDTMTLIATRTMVNLAARDKLDETWNALTTWARLLLDGGAVGELPTPVTAHSLAGWLADRINSVRYDEAGEQMYAEITKLRAQVVHLVDRAPSRVYAGPCHAATADGRCERPLYAWPGEGDIVCDGFGLDSDYDVGCRTEHTRAERADWLLAELEDLLMPLSFWQAWLPQLRPDLMWPSRSTWHAWSTTNRLEVKSIDREARELFRGGDVVALVTREQRRICGNRDRAKRGRMSA